MDYQIAPAEIRTMLGLNRVYDKNVSKVLTFCFPVMSTKATQARLIFESLPKLLYRDEIVMHGCELYVICCDMTY